MDYRDCVPRFPLLPGEPDRLLAELYEVQTELAIVEYYIRCWMVQPPAGNSPPSGRHSSVALDALRCARDIIDCVIENLRIESVETAVNGNGNKLDE